MKKIELLAPAGNFECLVAAVQSGADAVYLSGKCFGARSFADNFDDNQLEEAVDYCHLRNTKIYVTVNTLVFDDEMPELSRYLVFLNRIGVDAIIVQDMGVLDLARTIVPELPIHASTQMTIHNSDGVKALEDSGVKRIVLSRELSFESIKEISRKTTAELEVFAHGALCMSYSGQCLMSSIIGGRSGNRGKCAQPCRLPYSINDGKPKKFYMSLKDLSALEHVDTLLKMGVSSLKIEGRMKGPAYVAAVIGVYRKYIDTPGKIKKEDIMLLDTIFNRGGLTDGYLTEKHGRDMFAFSKPDNPYHKGSNSLEEELLKSIKNENRKLSLDCEIEIKLGCKPKIWVSYNNVEAEVIYDIIVSKAEKLSLTDETVKSRLSKTGGTPFWFNNITTDIDDDVFLTAGVLNDMRRLVLNKFQQEFVKSFKRETVENGCLILGDDELDAQTKFVCEVTSLKQLNAVKDEDFTSFWVPFHIINENIDELKSLKEKIVIVPPAIIHEYEAEEVNKRIEDLLKDGFFAVLALNIAQIQRFSKYKVFGGFRLNIFNSHALQFYKKIGLESAELSPELNLRQIRKIKKVIPVQTMVYGRLPLMITENCIIRNGAKCPCKQMGTITDRMGTVFPVIKDGNACRSVILNSKKTFMGFDMDKIKATGTHFCRLYFTDEPPMECKQICDVFLRGLVYRPEDFTAAHYLRGVQ